MKIKYLALMGLVFSLAFMAVLILGCGSQTRETLITSTTISTTTITTTTTTTTATTTTTTTLPKASKPVFTLADGDYDTAEATVTIEAGASGADAIYYTTDGSTPTTSSTEYTGSFVITASRNIKAIATKSGYQASEVASAQYTLWWWQALGTGMDEEVSDMVLDSSGNLFAVGYFTQAGGLTANHVAMWDGSSWSVLDSGLNSDTYAVAIDDSNRIYVGGAFSKTGDDSTTLNYVARWNGVSFESVGSGFSHPVRDLAFDGFGNLYACGTFTNAEGSPANHVAVWNGVSWLAMGSGVGSIAKEIAAAGTQIYIGGTFTSPTDYIAEWTGSWTGLSTGLDSYLDSMVIDSSGNLYAGGAFDNAGGTPAKHIAKWDGSSWSAMGSGLDSRPSCLTFDGEGNLYAAGSGPEFLARWTGLTWEIPWDGVFNDVVQTVVFDSDGTMYVGGLFSDAAGIDEADYIVRWAKIE